MKVPTKLQSRKLFVLLAIVLLVLSDYVFNLGIPSQPLLYIVGVGITYIISQGYVDGKQQSVSTFPVDDFVSAVTTIIQSEIQKTGFGKNLPMESIVTMVQNIMQQELGKLSVSMPPATITITKSTSDATVASNTDTPVIPQT